MAEKRAYALHSDEEPARLDRQAAIIRIEQFLPLIPDTPSGRLLDAGCGSGSMARLLGRTRPDAAITGVDVRGSYLDYARRKARAESVANVEFVEGSLLDMPFPNEHFDLAWACLVLHWLTPDDVPRAMRELVRVVRPGGWIVCAEPDGVGTNHYPIEPDLAEQWRKVTTSLFDPDMGRRLYPIMHHAGLAPIAVDIRPYFFHAFGEINPDVLDVILDSLRPALPRIAEILGSPDAANRLLDRIVEQHENPATTFLPLWFLAVGQKAG
jgi:ubiquinone/menaquinone biosynthesis C-methylase UbiE